MPRYIRNTAILAKLEAQYAQDAVPSGGADAILVSNVSVNPLNASNVDRDLIRNHFGASEHLVGTAFVEASFDVEFANSGTAGTAPAWGGLLEACAMMVSAGDGFIEYLLTTNSQKSVSIYYYDDGVVHKLLGAKGTATFKMATGERPVITFSFYGLDAGVAAGTPGAVDLSRFKVPLVVTNQHTIPIKLGVAYAGGAVTGGTEYPSQGLEVQLGNEVNHVPLIGDERIDITQRVSTATLRLELTAAQEVALMAEVKANALRSLAFQHGKTAGNIILLYAPAVQLINPSKQELNGRRMIGYDARFIPLEGNDELRIVLK